MAKKVHFTPAQLCALHQAVKEAEYNMATSSNQAHLLITLTILIDCLEWSADDLNWFTERYEEFLKSYREGNENLHELNNKIFEYSGIAIMDVYEEV